MGLWNEGQEMGIAEPRFGFLEINTEKNFFCDTSSPIAQRQVRPFDFSEVAVMSAHIYYMVSVGTCAVPIELKCTND